jgi:hypothetical protein
MKVLIWPVVLSFFFMLGGLVMFFFAFATTFDFKYPIYCDIYAFKDKDRIDFEKKLIIEEDMKDCTNYQPFYSYVGWRLLNALFAFLAAIFASIMGYVIYFNKKTTPMKSEEIAANQ